MALPPPQDLGPYQPVRMLASGAQSSVWLADSTHGELAIKVPRGQAGADALKAEIELFQRLDVPGLVRMVDVDPDGAWMAMERVDGTSLDQWARGRTDAEIIEVAVSLLKTLVALHEQGVVHGDLKPDNVMVTPQGKTSLLDLGIASLPRESRSGFKGTLGYAAPEVLRGEPATERSDLYGFGALLYRSLTGRDPFESNDPSALAYLPMVALPLPPSTWRPGLSQRIEQAVLTLLSRAPQRRPASAAKAIEILQKGAGTTPARWVLGMIEERDRLARSVVRAADGETQVVCVYGTPGSGRLTLITEAVQAARRLGLKVVQLSDIDSAFFKVSQSKRPSTVVVARAGQKRAIEVARAFLKTKTAGLVLLRSERPVPQLGDEAVQLSPPPLEPVDVSRLARHMRVDPELAERAWEHWSGHPAAILGALRSALPDYDPADDAHLSAEARQILEQLQAGPPVAVLDLASSMKLDPHSLLDHASVLVAEGRIGIERGVLSLAERPRG